MSKVTLSQRKDGKPSLSRSMHRDHLVIVTKPKVEPYKSGSLSARAWQVVSLMNGVTVTDAHFILELLEPNIQGKVGRPLGWVVDAIQLGHVEIHEPGSKKKKSR